MAIISRERGYLFLMAPRTGCTAIGERVLIADLDGAYLPAADVLDAQGNVVAAKKHSTLADLRRAALVTDAEAQSLVVFTAVRNPFDSLVSQYVKMRTSYAHLLHDPTSFVQRDPAYRESMEQAQQMRFDEWVAARYTRRDPKQIARRSTWRSPWTWLRRGWVGPRHMYDGFLRGAHHVMRFEHLQEDFDVVLGVLGLPPRSIPTWNVTEAKGDYRDYYDDKTRELVAHVFAPDLRRFGYTF